MVCMGQAFYGIGPNGAGVGSPGANAPGLSSHRSRAPKAAQEALHQQLAVVITPLPAPRLGRKFWVHTNPGRETPGATDLDPFRAKITQPHFPQMEEDMAMNRSA